MTEFPHKAYWHPRYGYANPHLPYGTEPEPEVTLSASPTGPAEPISVLTTVFTNNTYTLIASDANSEQLANNGATPAKIFIPLNAVNPVPIGTLVTITQQGTGKIRISVIPGVTVESSVANGFQSGVTGCRTKGSTISLLKIDTDTWVLAGDVA